MPRDDGLLAQHQFILSVIADPGFTGLDHRVAGEILKRYYPKHGNARASLRYLEQATGSDRKSIIASRDRLVAGGAFVVVREGAGTRPTEYLPDFGFGSSGGVAPTSSESAPSGGVEPTSCGGVQPTSSGASGGLQPTETYLQDPAYNAGILVDSTVVAPLAADGLPAAAPRAPDGFDSIWRAYGKLGSKVKSRAAFDALPNPDVEHIAERAAAWAASAKPGARRMPLERWIEQEKFDEAERSPAARVAKVEAGTRAGVWTPALRITAVEETGSVFSDWFFAVALDGDGAERRFRLQAAAAGESGPGADGDALACLFDALGDHAGWVGQRVRLQLDGETIVGAERCRVARRVRAVACELVQRRGELVLVLTLEGDDGAPEGRQEIIVESHDRAAQEAGQRRLQRLCEALGMDDMPEDESGFVGIAFTIGADGEFAATPAMSAAA